jgi:hypothetical protein
MRTGLATQNIDVLAVASGEVTGTAADDLLPVSVDIPDLSDFVGT